MQTFNKPQLIAEIRQHNHSAQEDFLQQFDPAELNEYLSHLVAAEKKVIRIGGWNRPRRKVS